MKLTELSLSGAYKIDLEKREDERGFFARLFCSKELLQAGLEKKIVQINNSYNKKKGTLRGLHFQNAPKAEIKIVRCIQGVIWDVIVDLRPNSETYGKWTGLELSAENRSMMFVPEGFAHGFISLTDDTEIIYFVTEEYSPEFEGAVRWNDPQINIKWPILPTEISEKDAKALLFEQL